MDGKEHLTMARINLVDPNAMTEEQQTQFKRFPANLTCALLRTGASTAAYLSLGASFLKAKLAPKDREFVILRVGTLSASEYERMQHLPIARGVGWSEEDIRAIEKGDQVALGVRSAALLRFVDECVSRIKVSSTTFADVREFLSEQEVAEITLLIGHYMMTARFLETLEIDLDKQSTPWTGMTAAD
jgi:alkylhydroperoxidase family enzyme